MTELRTVQELCLDKVTLSPRFGVEQGFKADGSVKVRPIDDFTRSGCNAATRAPEKLRYESVDAFLATIRSARPVREI